MKIIMLWQILKVEYNIVSESGMKVTGVTFTYEKDIFRKKNFTISLTKIGKVFNIRKQISISIIGKYKSSKYMEHPNKFIFIWKL